MSVEIGIEAAQFPEKEYINGILVALWSRYWRKNRVKCFLPRSNSWFFTEYWAMKPLAKFIVPDWGNKVDSGIRLSYRPVSDYEFGYSSVEHLQ